MNAARLRTLAEELLRDDQELQIQQLLGNLNTALSSLAAGPQDLQRQVAVSEQLGVLSEAVNKLYSRYDPAKLKQLENIGAIDFFGPKLVDVISKSISENAITPAVVQQKAATLLEARQKYLETLRSIVPGLEALGVKAEDLKEGEAEIGFLIPRDLFNNQLDGLIGELRAVNRIIRAFSELATGTAEPVEVREISTSDPLFIFGIDVGTIACIGMAITWALDVWSRVQKLRKARADTRQLGDFTEDEIEKFFGTKVKETIERSIDQKVTELLGSPDGKPGRKEEQRTDLKWALESIFARVERGMTVEIRFVPPRDAHAHQEDQQPGRENPFEVFNKVTPQLTFPAPEPSPIMALPPVPREPEEKPGQTHEAKARQQQQRHGHSKDT